MSRVRHTLLLFLFWVWKSDGDAVFRALGTLKHAQIAAVEWNREAIARVKAGVDVYGALAAVSPHVWY
jgi:protein-arginine kinase